MTTEREVVIVDYGMGNVFSILRACQHVGLPARLSADPAEVERAPGIILPGVGAFSAAMDTLRRFQLIDVLRSVAKTGTPLLGVCLGMQLLMERSEEFGSHEGLGLVKGNTLRLESHVKDGLRQKVPEVTWNRIWPVDHGAPAADFGSPWLKGITPGSHMYFVHSYYCRPAEKAIVETSTTFGDFEFCSSFRAGSMFGCQFHPERSGPAGLKIYENFKRLIQ